MARHAAISDSAHDRGFRLSAGCWPASSLPVPRGYAHQFRFTFSEGGSNWVTASCDPGFVHLPRNLADMAGRHEAIRRWVSQLPVLIEELVRHWQLRLGEPFEPGGACSWTAPAGDLVLKLGWRHPEAAHEPDALRLWVGDGAVRLHDTLIIDDTMALLLERCTPGNPLSARPEHEQDVVVAGLLRRLWRRLPPGHPFPPLHEMRDAWAGEFEQMPGVIDAGLARAGMDLLRELPRSATEQMMLCTDLHAGNILAARREPWLGIDPKPYLGDPCYDPVQHMLNCKRRLRDDPGGLAAKMAGLLDLDTDRVIQWLFARCVQESPDQPWLADAAARIAP